MGIELPIFLGQDPSGGKVLNLFNSLGDFFTSENKKLREQINNIQKCAVVINEVIATQQKYAVGTIYTEKLDAQELVEDALSTQSSALSRKFVSVEKEYEAVLCG